MGGDASAPPICTATEQATLKLEDLPTELLRDLLAAMKAKGVTAVQLPATLDDLYTLRPELEPEGQPSRTDTGPSLHSNPPVDK